MPEQTLLNVYDVNEWNSTEKNDEICDEWKKQQLILI